MEALRRLTFACIALVAVVSGCATPVPKSTDPFAATAQAANAASPATANGNSVQQATYEGAVPGQSLNDQLVDDEPTFWERTADKMSTKSVKRRWKSLTGRAPDEVVARKAYNEGDALFREGKFDEAADKFEIAIERWPDSLLEEDAMYMLGESYFFADRYSKASATFDQLLKTYQNSRHLDRVVSRQFALGRYWDEIGKDKYMLAPNFTDKTRPWFDTHGNGIKVYENIRLSDPLGPLADDAVMAQGTAYFIDNRYEDAAFQYEILRKDYPQSDHQKQAHLLGLQSYLNAYQGPQYDKTPIKKADTLVDSTIRNLGHTMPEERPRLEQAKDAVRAQLAERDYDLGEYYRRLGYNRAARSHYAIVLRDFPDTKFAEMAQQRMQETEGLAPEPPDYFPWLTKWLAREPA